MVVQRKTENLYVNVDTNLVNDRVSKLQTSLTGKLSLAPWDKPYSLKDLTQKI